MILIWQKKISKVKSRNEIIRHIEEKILSLEKQVNKELDELPSFDEFEKKFSVVEEKLTQEGMELKQIDTKIDQVISSQKELEIREKRIEEAEHKIENKLAEKISEHHKIKFFTKDFVQGIIVGILLSLIIFLIRNITSRGI